MPFYARPYTQRLSMEELAELTANHLNLGYHPDLGDELLVSTDDRYTGMYCLGTSGKGKSALLENCIMQDCAQGHAVIVIDPHGDLTTHCIQRLPEELLEKTSLLDMLDTEYPFGLNPFARTGLEDDVIHTQAVDSVRHIFQVIWPDIAEQQHLPRYLRMATITLLANPGTTLLDMHRLFFDDKFRHELLKQVHDPTIVQFWQFQYERLNPRDRLEYVRPLISRLENLLLGRRIVRNIVGQPHSTIDLHQAIENKEIIFVKLPLRKLEQDSQLIGTVIVAQIYAALFSFGDLPEQERPGVSVYVDEFQNFASEDFAKMLTEGRKFGLRLTVAHQLRSQLTKDLQDAVMGAHTKVCFQLTPDDGREMADFYLHGKPVVQPEDVDPHPVRHLLTYGSDNIWVQRFLEFYLQPIQSHIKGKHVEIVPKIDWVKEIGRIFSDRPKSPNPSVADPTQYLDGLLYKVMASGDPTLPIPPEVIYGFSGMGHPFYWYYAYYPWKRWLLSNDITYDYLMNIIKLPNGEHTITRLPETGREELFHFIFLLRKVMQYLAAEPIGEESELRKSDAALGLSHLPRRAAWVRSGDEVGVIYTHSLPGPDGVDGSPARLQSVMARTRKRYCKSRREVEAAKKPPASSKGEVQIIPSLPSEAVTVQAIPRVEVVDE